MLFSSRGFYFTKSILLAFLLEISISYGILCWFPLLLTSCFFKIYIYIFSAIFSDLG